jgi:hypothetical protein
MLQSDVSQRIGLVFQGRLALAACSTGLGFVAWLRRRGISLFQ